MINNDSTINVETKNNRVTKLTKLHSIQLDLHYNISVLLAIILYRTYSDDNNDSTINVETKKQ